MLKKQEDQAYFYTRDWQKDEAQAQEDIRKGRVTKTKNLKQLFKKLTKLSNLRKIGTHDLLRNP